MRPSGCPAVVKLSLPPHGKTDICTNSAVSSAGGTKTDTDRHRHAAGIGTVLNATRNSGEGLVAGIVQLELKGRMAFSELVNSLHHDTQSCHTCGAHEVFHTISATTGCMPNIVLICSRRDEMWLSQPSYIKTVAKIWLLNKLCVFII